jgi:GxxExxY protein
VRSSWANRIGCIEGWGRGCSSPSTRWFWRGCLERRGLSVQRQKSVRFQYDGLSFEDGLRIDLLVEGSLVVELKSTESIAAAHTKQLLTYLRLLELPLGLLINFGAPTFKSGVKRVVNRHSDTTSSRLRIHTLQRPNDLNPEA